ncbi:MAG: creatininase family protein [Candidatus Xenobia bacterium]
MPPGVRLENLSWDEAEPLLKEPRVVVLPLGARLKEHGLHLPLNNDWRMAEWLAEEVLKQRPVILLPTIQYNFFPAFVEYPGSVNLSQETSCALVCDIIRSLARHGARRFYVLNTGISTNRPLEQARERLAAEDVVLRYTHLGDALRAAEQSIRQQPRGTHADEMETSMMLVIAPDTVRMERARPDANPDRGPGGLTRNPDKATGVYSPTGAWGDPTLATVEKGRVLLKALVTAILHDIDQMG